MFSLLWLLPALPLAAFLILLAAGPFLSRGGVAMLGVGSTALAALIATGIGLEYLMVAAPGAVYTQPLWTWLRVGSFRPVIALTLDPLSLVMILVVTVVGFLIHLYSAEHMAEDDGYRRFFAYMNLFVGAMLILVLADNLLLLYLGWEGVGLCSFLLIGFWYKGEANVRAARKAFVVTRIGDTALALGLFLLFQQLGSLRIPTLLTRATALWPAGAPQATLAAALLLAGAVGKSAQLPLQTWLPDAMAGPTPVSALIHAATMVTAGVYLIARLHPLYSLAPSVMALVAIVGAATLLLAGLSATAQRDIKRVLAYSTISQVGYMFLALGVGAWPAAIFHLTTHAAFKALLFLGAGVVIHALHEDHDLTHMGGLRRDLPVTFWTFLIAGGSLAGLPLVTAGFYSKELILWSAISGRAGNAWLWLAGLCGTLLTSIYIFRVVFLVFFGPRRATISRRPGAAVQLSLLILAALSVLGGLLQLPPGLGNRPLFSRFLDPTSSTEVGHADLSLELSAMGLATAVSLFGLYLAYRWFVVQRVVSPEEPAAATGRVPVWPARLDALLAQGFGFDWLYERALVRPVWSLARGAASDAVDVLFRALAWLVRAGHAGVRQTQTGQLRWYAAGIAMGALILLALVVLQ